MLVLIVDDSAVSRKVAKIALQDLGFKFLEGTNGKEGLELYKQHHPNCVVTDIQMPEMEGPELGKNIREIDLRCPIIYMTADNTAPAWWRSLKDPFSEVIKKPNLNEISAFKTELNFKLQRLRAKLT